MMLKLSTTLAGLAAAACLALPASAEDVKSSLKKGTPDLKSAGSITFGPEGILFVGDTQGAAVFAIDTGEAQGETEPIQVEAINEKIAQRLGTDVRQIQIQDMAVHPQTGRAYLSVSRGRGPDAMPVILRVDAAGKIEEVELKDIPFAKADLPNPPDPNAEERGRSLRAQAITDMVFADGRLYVAGLSNEEFSSRLLSMPFPFSDEANQANLEIYHGAHGRFETRSPVRTFIAAQLEGESTILASYTCTPLVKISMDQLKAGGHVKGTTIAELGNRNTPLDMVVYEKEGVNYLLMANTARGVMKIDLTNSSSIDGITSRIAETAGLPFETVVAVGDVELDGVVQLDQLDEKHALILREIDNGVQNLLTIQLP